MMFSKLATTTALLVSAIMPGVHAQGSDYIDAAPATVYEAEEMSPQNMDFDMANNMFVAHSGWYNDQLIHYYKFRIFAPGTYQDVIMPGGTSAEVPLQKIYFVTTDGTMDGVVGMPIIEYHTSDGVLYSDFMVAVLVDAPDGYVADTFKSVGDITDAGATMTETSVVMNMPVVPTGSTLQDPMAGGTAKAPIMPTMVFYKGVEVQTFVFEVTDAAAATYFADTRDTATSVSRQGDTGYEITVTNFATADFVSAIPLWHVNQFSTGVVEGMGGGPNPAGMRNVINLDRPDNGYSPLWNIRWATEMPINYMADEFSNAEQGTAENGFVFFTTPMYINCPDIGMVGEMNTLKATSFETTIMLGCEDLTSFMLIGSDAAVILTADEPIMFVAMPSGETVGETVTNGMGGYEYDLMKDDIPADTTEIVVMHNGESIRTIMVTMDECMMTDSSAATFGVAALGLVAAMMAVIMV